LVQKTFREINDGDDGHFSPFTERAKRKVSAGSW
jgi:hypothetical protein